MTSCSGVIVADVDGSRIRADDLATSIQIEKEKYDPILLKTEENTNALKRAVLESLIQEAILLDIAKKGNVTVSDDELKKYFETSTEPVMFNKRAVSSDVWKTRQRNRMIINKLIKKEVADRIPVTPQEIQEYYKEHKADFHQPTQYHARQIVVDSKELANQISARIAKGEDFAVLAEEFSLSPDRKRGGDLGFFNASTFPPVFAEICEKLKPGETSDVVATDYGYQIFKLLEKRRARQRTLEEATVEIESLLKEKRLEKAFEEWFKLQREKAKVKIYEKELEDVNV